MEKIEPDRIVLKLVNLSAFDARRVVVQAGAFGEHTFTRVAAVSDNPGVTASIVEVNAPACVVELPPSGTITLDMGMKRFANKPSYAFPWQKNGR